MHWCSSEVAETMLLLKTPWTSICYTEYLATGTVCMLDSPIFVLSHMCTYMVMFF